jgi:hypothetical protein
LAALAEKGFDHLELRLEAAGGSLPHITLSGCKQDEPLLLLDACVGEAVVRPEFFARRGSAIDRPIELAVVHWVREEDPTAQFGPDRQQLPLQHHPGLGVLRRAFRVVVSMARELQKDGVASVPKFFHDAVIFHHSRLFLFLDGREQGSFEALTHHLRLLPLADASLALVSGSVSDAVGGVVDWAPGYQVFPVSPELTAYFHSEHYAAQVAAARETYRVVYDLEAVTRARRLVSVR